MQSHAGYMLLFSFFSAGAVAASPLPKVPAGFESLLEGQEELVDVTLAGRSLGLFNVLVKPDTLLFSQPDLVFDALSADLIDQPTREKAKTALTLPLARNGNLACNGTHNVGCGYINTDDVATIFDESQGAVQLFINTAWLAHNGLDKRLNTLTATAENAFIHRQTINYSGDKYSKNMSFNGAGALGLGENRYLGGDWAMSWNKANNHQENQFWFNNLYARQDLGQRHYLQGGRMDQRNLSSPLGGSFNFTMLPLTRFNGVRVGTTSAYINYNVSQDATPVMIQTNRNARVDIYRDTQLLGSQYFSAGINAINTDTFPGGAYVLELKIYEDGVLQHTERQPFSKSGSSLNNGLQWFVQGGQRDIDNSGAVNNNKKAVAATGLQIGLYRDLQLTSGVSLANGNTYNETRLDAQHAFSLGVLSLGGSLFNGNDGSRGDVQQITFTDGFMLSLYRYNAGGSACDKASDSKLNTGCYTSLSSTLSVPFAGWTSTLGYTETRNKGRSYWTEEPDSLMNPSRRYYQSGSRAQSWQLATNRSFNFKSINVNSRIGIYQNNYGVLKDRGGFLGFTLSRASQPAVTSGHDSYTSAGIDYRSGKYTQANYNLNHTMMWQQGMYRELGLTFSGDKDRSYTGGLAGRITGRYGDLTGTLTESYSRGYSSRNAFTSAYSSAMSVSKSGIFFGGGGSGEPAAGVAVRVENNDTKGDAAHIRGASYRPVTLGFGDSTLMLVEGYQNASVDVQDTSGTTRDGVANVSKGGGSGAYFLAPGHLVIREVSSSITWIYIGRALAADGRPLGNAQVLNQPLPALGKNGRFTLQANSNVEALWLMDNGQLLRCPLKVKSTRDVLRIVGDVRCTAAGVEGLPQSLKMTPRVMRLLASVR